MGDLGMPLINQKFFLIFIFIFLFRSPLLVGAETKPHPWDESLQLKKISLRSLGIPNPKSLQNFIEKHNLVVESRYRHIMFSAVLSSIKTTVEVQFPQVDSKAFVNALRTELLKNISISSESLGSTRWKAIKLATELILNDHSDANPSMFEASVLKAFQKYEAWAIKDFLTELAEGRFDFKTSRLARIKYSYVGRDSKAQVIAKIVPSGKKASIIVTNLPLEFNFQKSVRDQDFEIQQYNRRLRREYGNDVLIAGFENGKLEPYSFYIPPQNIFTKSLNYFVSSYEKPNLHAPAIALLSSAIQLSILTGGFWVDTNFIQDAPADVLEVIQKNAPALLVKGTYGMFCATFSHFYDRLVRDKSPLLETLKKTGYVLPANYAVFGLTYGWLNPSSVALASLLSLGEKLASTFMIRKVRLQAEEGLLHGDYELKINDLAHPESLAPVRWIRKIFQKPEPKKEDRIDRELETDRELEAKHHLEDRPWLQRIRDFNLIRANKVVVAREWQGGIRSVMKTGSFTIDESIGVPIFTLGLYAIALASHKRALSIAKERADYYRSQGEERIAKRFDRHIEGLKEDQWLIPGLKPWITKTWQQSSLRAMTSKCALKLKILKKNSP